MNSIKDSVGAALKTHRTSDKRHKQESARAGPVQGLGQVESLAMQRPK